MVSAVTRRRTEAPNPLSSEPSSSNRRPKSKRDTYSDVCCEECGSGENGAELLLCDRCERGFHLFCLRPILVYVPKGSWFCPPCSNNPKKPSSFPLIQTKIVDFFRIQRSSEPIQRLCQDKQKKTRRTSCLVTKRRRSCCHSVKVKILRG